MICLSQNYLPINENDIPTYQNTYVASVWLNPKIVTESLLLPCSIELIGSDEHEGILSAKVNEKNYQINALTIGR